MLRRVPAAIRRLRADTSGVALIEYAISLPVLLTVGLGGIEIANYAMANMRISQIAMTTADNAGRVRESIGEADILELMEGAKDVGRGIDFAENGRIILSDVEATPDGSRQWVRWQRCAGKLNVTSTFGTPRDKAGNEITAFSDAAKADTDYGAAQDRFVAEGVTQIGPAANPIAAVPGTALMFVEITYDYQPIVANRYLGTRQMKYTGAFNVRQRTDQTLKRGSVTTAQMATCGKFAA